MAQYTITLTEISAEMLDELSDFAHTRWGRTDIVEVAVIPGQGTYPAVGAVELALPTPVPATTATSTIEVILPPEPIDDFTEPAPTPAGRKGRG